MARPRKTAETGDFARLVAQFQAEFPAEWEALKLCPLQHGLDDMARLLK